MWLKGRKKELRDLKIARRINYRPGNLANTVGEVGAPSKRVGCVARQPVAPIYPFHEFDDGCGQTVAAIH